MQSTATPPDSRTPLVEARDLAKSFAVGTGFFSRKRAVRAVDGVSLTVARGETLGLVGESGCGKSTLGRALLKLVEPTGGQVLYDGRDITCLSSAQMRPLRRRMQIVFQDPYSSLDPRQTIGGIVGEALTIHKLAPTREAYHARVSELLSRVGIDPEARDRYPHEFSGGQRQRVGIARALAVEPSFIVCDEPLSALDVSVQAQIVNLFQDLQDQLGLSYLLISHDLKVVEYMSHRVAVMYFGRIVETAPSASLFEKRHHPYTRALFSAIPSVDAAHAPRRLLVRGDPPSPLVPLPGCPFAPRCPNARPGKCDVDVPPLAELEVGSGHQVACWFPDE